MSGIAQVNELKTPVSRETERRIETEPGIVRAGNDDTGTEQRLSQQRAIDAKAYRIGGCDKEFCADWRTQDKLRIGRCQASGSRLPR